MINAITTGQYIVGSRADQLAIDYINQVVLANCASSSNRTTFLTNTTACINQLRTMDIAVELYLGNTVTYPTYSSSVPIYINVVPVWTGSPVYGDDRGLLTAASKVLAGLLAKYTAQVNYLLLNTDGSGAYGDPNHPKTSNYTTAQTTLLADLATLAADVLVL